MIVVSKDMTRTVCTCRRLPSGQSIYEFQFNVRPLVSDSVPSVIFSSDGVNLVVCGVNSSKHQHSGELTSSHDSATAAATGDDVLFIIRQLNTGNVVAKLKLNHPEYRSLL